MKILTLLTILFTFSCTKKPRAIMPLEVYGMQNNGFAILVDLRNDAPVRPERSTHFTENDIFTENAKWKTFQNKISRNKTLVFVGQNAKKVAEDPRSGSFKKAYILDFTKWQRDGLPTTQSR